MRTRVKASNGHRFMIANNTYFEAWCQASASTNTSSAPTPKMMKTVRYCMRPKYLTCNTNAYGKIDAGIDRKICETATLARKKD